MIPEEGKDIINPSIKKTANCQFIKQLAIFINSFTEYIQNYRLIS